MATLAVQIGGLLMAFALVWPGIQGLRGVPDSSGRKTSRGTAIACLVLAVLLAIGALAAPSFMWG